MSEDEQDEIDRAALPKRLERLKARGFELPALDKDWPRLRVIDERGSRAETDEGASAEGELV